MAGGVGEAKRPVIGKRMRRRFYAGGQGAVRHGLEIGDARVSPPLRLAFLNGQERRDFIEALVAEIAGQPLTLRTQVREGLTVTPPPPREPEKPKDPMEEFKNDPLIKKALELFRAEIQPA